MAPVKDKKRTFKTFSYRGVDLDDIEALTPEAFKGLVTSRIRRHFNRVTPDRKEKIDRLVKKLVVARSNLGPGEKPKVVKTYLRAIPVTPEMIGSVVGVYNGKNFITVELRPEMLGHYLAEFALTYKPVVHKNSAACAAKVARFVPLK